MSDSRSNRILIVDDQVEMVSMLKGLLRRLGFVDLLGTTCPLEAIELFGSFQPDLVILDWHMPQVNGDTVIRCLRKTIARDEYLPILVLTGCPSVETRKEALRAGASDLLEKPFEMAVGYMRIMNLLEIRELHRRVRAENEALETKVADRTRDLARKSSELEAALAQLRQSQEQILQQERLRAFGEMAGGIVHDFNNALMLVTGYSEVLLRNESMLANPARVRSFLEIMHGAGQDATRVIARLREFYEPRAASDALGAIDLNTILEEAAQLTAPKWRDEARAQGREILLTLDLARVPEIQGCSEEIRCALSYLIFNAVEAMPSGGALRIRSGADEERVTIEVSDTGCGMTEEAIRRCREPYFSTKPERGVGLGLSAAFGIFQRHGATLAFDSQVDRGTTCRIDFPVDRSERSVVPGEIVTGLRVLVVDDEPVLRDLIGMYLENDRHAATVAANGREALALLEANEFDLIISDMAMPGLSGAQLLAEVKARQPGLKAILLSGFDAFDSPSPSWDATLLKPVSQERLRETVAQLCAASEPLTDDEPLRLRPLTALPMNDEIRQFASAN